MIYPEKGMSQDLERNFSGIFFSSKWRPGVLTPTLGHAQTQMEKNSTEYLQQYVDLVNVSFENTNQFNDSRKAQHKRVKLYRNNC